MSTSTQDIALSSERRQNSSGQSPCEFRCWDYLKNLHNLLLKYFILNSLEFRQEMLRAILYWTKFLFDIRNWFWQKCKSEVNFCCCKNDQYYWWLWANFSMTCQHHQRSVAWWRCVRYWSVVRQTLSGQTVQRPPPTTGRCTNVILHLSLSLTITKISHKKWIISESLRSENWGESDLHLLHLHWLEGGGPPHLQDALSDAFPREVSGECDLSDDQIGMWWSSIGLLTGGSQTDQSSIGQTGGGQWSLLVRPGPSRESRPLVYRSTVTTTDHPPIVGRPLGETRTLTDHNQSYSVPPILRCIYRSHWDTSTLLFIPALHSECLFAAYCPPFV